MKDEIVSEPNADFIWRTCEDEHLPENKKRGVVKIAGYVFFGFLHPGDFARELKDALQLNPQAAEVIAKAVNERVFNPIKDDLSRSYAPVPHEDEEETEAETIAPKSFEDLRKPSSVGNIEAENVQVGLPPKTPPLSTNRYDSPKIQIELSPSKAPGAVSVPSPFIKPVAPPAPPPSAGAPPLPPIKSATAPISSAPKVAEDGEPLPKMLHEEMTLKPLKPPANFNLSAMMPKSLDAKNNKESAPPKPAVLELGTAPQKPPQMPSSLAADSKNPAVKPSDAKPAVRIVHYTESSTTLPKNPSLSSGGNREIQELTATPPSPASSPSAPFGGGSSPKPSMTPVWPLPADMPNKSFVSPPVGAPKPPTPMFPTPPTPPATSMPFQNPPAPRMNDVAFQPPPITAPPLPNRPSPPVVSRIEPPPQPNRWPSPPPPTPPRL